MSNTWYKVKKFTKKEKREKMKDKIIVRYELSHLWSHTCEKPPQENGRDLPPILR
jgi:hypothetical protein